MTFPLEHDASTRLSLERLHQGDREALDEMLTRFRSRLRRMVELRLDRRVQARLEASDVVQEAYLEATRRIEDYLRKPTMPFFLWLGPPRGLAA